MSNGCEIRVPLLAASGSALLGLFERVAGPLPPGAAYGSALYGPVASASYSLSTCLNRASRACAVNDDPVRDDAAVPWPYRIAS